MVDTFEMRARLQQVAAYRDLCRSVRRSGRDNLLVVGLMMLLAYLAWENGVPPLFLLVYGLLIAGELLAGLIKFVAPSAEGVLLDALVLLAFALFNFGIQALRLQANLPANPVAVFLGLFMLFGAIGRFRAYNQLRVLFAERPAREHLRWFDELAREVLAADPETDPDTLDLPTRPHWKVKLLGPLAVLVAVRGQEVLIAGPDDLELLREPEDHGTGRRKALLQVHGQAFPEFEISDASWANYQKWRAAHPSRWTTEPA